MPFLQMSILIVIFLAFLFIITITVITAGEMIDAGRKWLGWAIICLTPILVSLLYFSVAFVLL